jgi:hypothetical protein
MSLNLVTVTISATPSPVDEDPVEGHATFIPDGTRWGAGDPVVPELQHVVLSNSTASVTLVASDNFAAGVLNWDININIRGLPTVNVGGVPVNFASGATQDVWAILQTFGWIPLTAAGGTQIPQP